MSDYYADNFRDVAGSVGYPVAGGGQMRRGLCFRSAEIVLTAEQIEAWKPLGVTAIYDLRDDFEVEAHPDAMIDGAERRHVPVLGTPMEQIAALPDVAAAQATMHDVYERFVAQEGAREAFATVLRGIAAAPGPVVFHCTSGKDRTGWLAMLLQHIAGVDDATILADYLLTNEVSTTTRAKYLALITEHLGPEFVAVYEPVFRVETSYLQAGRDAIEQRYGSVDEYVSAGLGLESDVVHALRERLVDS